MMNHRNGPLHHMDFVTGPGFNRTQSVNHSDVDDYLEKYISKYWRML
jgi:hypothetical protein